MANPGIRTQKKMILLQVHQALTVRLMRSLWQIQVVSIPAIHRALTEPFTEP